MSHQHKAHIGTIIDLIIPNKNMKTGQTSLRFSSPDCVAGLKESISGRSDMTDANCRKALYRQFPIFEDVRIREHLRKRLKTPNNDQAIAAVVSYLAQLRVPQINNSVNGTLVDIAYDMEAKKPLTPIVPRKAERRFSSFAPKF